MSRSVRWILIAVSVLAWPPAGAHDGDELGTVVFPTTCDGRVQARFERGLALLHSFWFSAAAKTFNEVLEQDPQCAMAYWGLAVNSLGNTLVGPPPLRDLQAGAAAAAKARAIDRVSEREKDWIGAISAWYRDHETVSLDTRASAYTAALEAMTRKYPDDDEVSIYYALALQASAPKADKTYADQRKAAAILERLYAKNPQHPGAAHYLIHAYDFPPLAEHGVPAARKYATIAPASAHARHMPSHIYSMLGMWEDSIKSNASAVEIQPDYYHARDFAVYAQLQLGQDAAARAAIDAALKEHERSPTTFNGFKNSIVAMPARFPLDHSDWAGAAALPVVSVQWPFADSLARYARGLGMARSGDLAGARAEIEALKGQRRALEDAKQPYWATRVDEEILSVSGWIAATEGDLARAEKLLRAAADGEDAAVKNVAMEIRLSPMREQLADLLMQAGRPADALREYEASLEENPNRLRGLYRGALAAEAAGKRDHAQDLFRKVAALGEHADTARPEFARAKAFLAQR